MSSISASTAITILVVEDNLTNQKVIVRQLESLGYKADVVGSGLAALDAVKQKPYQIIFMDCRLPEVDGYAATRLIRQHEQLSGRKCIIIALTASDDPRIQAETQAAGMDDFLAKPLRRETLATTLERWIQVAKDKASLASASPNISAPIDRANHLDLARLQQLSDYNLEFEQELLQLYLTDTQMHLQQLQEMVKQQNLLQIERVAHHIRGASASIGARKLEVIAEATEQQAKQQQLESACNLAKQLEKKFNQLKLALTHSNQLS